MPPTELDLRMRDWLDAMGKSFTVVLTKVDKLSTSRRAIARQDTTRIMGVADVLLSSARAGTGKKEILQHIFSVV